MTVNFLAYFCPIFFFLWQDLKFQTHFPLPSRKLLSSSSSGSQLVYARKGKLIECSPKWSIIRKKNAGKKKSISAFWKLSKYDFGIIYALFPGCWHGSLRAACPGIGPDGDSRVEERWIFSQELDSSSMFPEVQQPMGSEWSQTRVPNVRSLHTFLPLPTPPATPN